MAAASKPSSLLDTRVVYCGDNLDQLRKLPPASVDLIYIDPPFNSNRNYEVFLGETKEKRAFEDRHESTKAYIESYARQWNQRDIGNNFPSLTYFGSRPPLDSQAIDPEENSFSYK